MKHIKTATLEGKKVLIRVDYNLPVDDKNLPTDDSRIVATLPTLKWLLASGVEQIVIMTHWGRPEKEDDTWRLMPIAQVLAKILKDQGLIGTERVMTKTTRMKSPILTRQYCIGRSITMLENLRFDPREEENSSELAKEIASLADLYVNDAFATCHRAHTSLVAITKELPSYAGMLLLDEVSHLNAIRNIEDRPFVAIIGGAKIKDKIPVINMMRKKADAILIGGKTANEYYAEITEDVDKLVFPSDGVDESGKIVPFDKDTVKNNPPYDIGPDTLVRFKGILKTAKTVFWNGSLGMAESQKFCHGSNEIARFIANMRAVTVISGGDTAQIVDKLKLKNRYSYISTGGGAASKYIAGEELPGIEALS